MIAPVERIVADGHGHIEPELLVIHSTANPGATAENHVDYWASGRTGEYTHYVVDWAGDFFHTCPDDRKCWHVGNANYKTIGIEVCEVADESDFAESIDYAAQAAAWILADHGWGIDRMVSHAYCSAVYGGSDHTDPLPYLNAYGRTWDDFEALVDKYLSGEETDPEKELERLIMGCMNCIIDFNSEGRAVYFDGRDLHWLSHPDEIKALDAVHRACNGDQPIPTFALGTPEAPWASRLQQALEDDGMDALRRFEPRV